MAHHRFGSQDSGAGDAFLGTGEAIRTELVEELGQACTQQRLLVGVVTEDQVDQEAELRAEAAGVGGGELDRRPVLPCRRREEEPGDRQLEARAKATISSASKRRTNLPPTERSACDQLALDQRTPR